MNNHYIISTDLHKIYQNQLNLINQPNKSDNSYISDLTLTLDLNTLLIEYYSLNNYNYDHIDIEPYKKYLLGKYNIDNNDLIIFDKYNFSNIYLKDPSKYLNYIQGIIVFDYSLLVKEEIKSNIIYLMSNYENVTLNKIYDNYIIHFKNKFKSTIDLNFNNQLTEIFTNDVRHQLIYQRINRIPRLLNNKHMSNKLKDDITYLNQNIKDTYKKYYCGSNIKHDLTYLNYEKSLMASLNSDNYKVAYVFVNDIKNIDPHMYKNVLDKLKEYNIYIESIINDLNNYDDNLAFNLEVELNETPSTHAEFVQFPKTKVFGNLHNINMDEFTNLMSKININDIFDIDKLSDLYQEIKKKTNSNIILNMNDVLDKFIEITTKQSNDHSSVRAEINSDPNRELGDSNNFIYNILKFANELIKRKMIKTIKLFNYANNKINILNNSNKL